MFWIISWAFYGLIVGFLAKMLHPGDDPIGFLPTIGIGVVGSYLGGVLNLGLCWVLGWTSVAPGIIMSIIGGVLFCYIYKRFHLSKYLTAQKAEIEEQKVQIQNLKNALPNQSNGV